MPPSSLPLCF
uniref:Uncharacterized protein n=1 Tax=Arundo donax TaxID=35708 RepID=A0A0A8YR06_ARUDO